MNITKIIQKISAFSTVIIPKKKLNVVNEDPNDNIIIECAVESFSDYIVTYDKHLLKIKKYKDIEIVKPEEIL